MPWHLLLQIRTVHIKLAGLLAIATVALTGALVGGWLGGWKGALLVPVAGLSLLALGLHLGLWLLSRHGLAVHRRGNHTHALKILWLFQLPALRRYDRQGLLKIAFDDCKEIAGGALLAGALQSLLGLQGWPPRSVQR